jgi:hypothetical protein
MRSQAVVAAHRALKSAIACSRLVEYPLGQKIEAEKNGDTVLIRGSPVGRGDYDL